MKLSEQWLRDWVNPEVETKALVEQLTMLGLEVEGLEIVPALNVKRDAFFDSPTDVSLPKDAMDQVLEIALTPNRGDCLSVLGMAREVVAAYDLSLPSLDLPAVNLAIKDTRHVNVDEVAACPRYLGRVIKNIRMVESPDWLQESLTQSGINPVSAVVDILNYVMLELGQPMHAFDLDKIEGDIDIRYAKSEEALALLNEQDVILKEKTLVIADQKGPLAIAGVMGGLASSVTDNTKTVFLESAFFSPLVIAGKAREYNVQTDAAYRFERGVDFNLQRLALERATLLLQSIMGGEAGPIVEVVSDESLPRQKNISLLTQEVNDALGLHLTTRKIQEIFKRLGMEVKEKDNGLNVIIPTYRFDLTIPEDLIEEVARIYGYQRIPVCLPVTKNQTSWSEDKTKIEMKIKNWMLAAGYNEAITYSFVSADLQKKLDPNAEQLVLANPLSPEMAVMRTTLWPGLITALEYNIHRQQSRVRFFEVGRRFSRDHQEMVLSGLVSGASFPEQWSDRHEKVDFFDLKGDLERLFHCMDIQTVQFVAGEHDALHPGQTAHIKINDKVVGMLGLMHPGVAQKCDIKAPVFLFEIKMDVFHETVLPVFKSVSKFPSVRRDFAFIVNETIASELLVTAAKEAFGNILIDHVVFDVFTGKPIEVGKKSLAIGLILQHSTRTLKDEEVEAASHQFVEALKGAYQAELR